MGTKDRYDIHNAPSLINECDVIITDGYKHFIGVFYDKDKFPAPIVVCKYSEEYICFLKKIAEILEIPCIEDEETARTLSEEVEPGDVIPEKLYRTLSRIYIKLQKRGCREDNSGKNSGENFLQHLNNDTYDQIFSLEKRCYRRAVKEFFKSAYNKQSFKGNVSRFFEDELHDLAEKYGLNYRIAYDKAYELDVLYLELFIKEVDLDFYQLVFIHKPEQKIYIGSRTVFKDFDFCEAENALRFFKVLVETCNGRLKKRVLKFSKEFQINSRQYVIAHDSMKAILETSYNQTGKEYGSRSDTTVFEIYLKKVMQYADDNSDPPKNKSSKMYQIVITYKEFLRNPDFFRKFITNPHRMEKWNFWCEERKYNPECFKEKTQTID